MWCLIHNSDLQIYSVCIIATCWQQSQTSPTYRWGLCHTLLIQFDVTERHSVHLCPGGEIDDNLQHQHTVLGGQTSDITRFVLACARRCARKMFCHPGVASVPWQPTQQQRQQQMMA